MSSRALRRAQKELEERQRLEKLQLAQSDEDFSEEEPEPVSKPKPSLFAMLGDTADDDNDEDDQDAAPEKDVSAASSEAERPAPPPKTQKSKKKKKGKNKAKAAQPEKPTSSDVDFDELLAALSISRDDDSAAQQAISEEHQQLYSVLSVETQQLKAQNEERKLFGSIALQGHHEEQPRPRQRGGRGQPQSRNLGQLGLRKNIFVQGKEEWPRATTGGLAMELVEKHSNGTVEYRFIHNKPYQEIQKQFEVCVESMDSERMVHLLHYNPYHISTLLQVSEIYKQQRERAQAGDLLERALFNFGRAVHSTFSHNLAQGKARLDFRRYENREFWLAVWRYIEILGQRSLWRTAFEWTKLLLSLAPETDPYCMRLLIDQVALRGREPQKIVAIVECDYLERLYRIPPNFAYSVALAHDRLKNPQKARSSLKLAVEQYPWIAARLCKELDIAPIPKSVWGKEPNDDYQELLCQLYVTKAKDLWNTPEATALLMEILHTFTEPVEPPEDVYWLAEIPELDLARHVILVNDPALLSLLDKRVKAKYTSVSDPLPPDEAIESYIATSGAEVPDYFARAVRLMNELRDENNGDITPQLIAQIEHLRRAEIQQLRDQDPTWLLAELEELRQRHLSVRTMTREELARSWADVMRTEWRHSVLTGVLRELGILDPPGDGDEGEQPSDSSSDM